MVDRLLISLLCAIEIHVESSRMIKISAYARESFSAKVFLDKSDRQFLISVVSESMFIEGHKSIGKRTSSYNVIITTSKDRFFSNSPELMHALQDSGISETRLSLYYFTYTHSVDRPKIPIGIG